jgi:hypothetical protein
VVIKTKGRGEKGEKGEKGGNGGGKETRWEGNIEREVR